jgi:hypothetical protein
MMSTGIKLARALLVTVATVFVAGASQASPHGGQWGGFAFGRGHRDGGSGSHDRRDHSGGRGGGWFSHDRGGVRDGDSRRGDGGDRRTGPRGHGGDGQAGVRRGSAADFSHGYSGWRSSGHRSYVGGPRYRYGGGQTRYPSYGYGSGYHVRYGGPARYCYRYRPRLFLGLGLGYTYYAPPTYGYDPAPVVVEPAPVYRDAPPPSDDRDYGDQGRAPADESGQIDVTNEPPDGCYYYDSFCGKRFSTLDDYTEHLQGHHHDQAIMIIERDSGDTLRTLEFVDGYWQVQK